MGGLLSPAINVTVTSADSVSNVNISDVVGNKTDTTSGTSLVSLQKIADAAIAVVDAFHDVPAADSADNVVMSDVLGNKSDTHSGTSVMANVKRIEEHNHNTQCVYPVLADAIVLTSSASAWTFGAYVEIVPVSTIASDFDIHFINISALSANDEYVVELASGAGASEVLLCQVSAVRSAVQNQGAASPTSTIIIPANTRISARIASKDASANTGAIKIWYHTY